MPPTIRSVLAALGVGLIVVATGWVDSGLIPGSGIDGSWNGALHMAAHSDLAWGRELIWTYGPLGFLKRPAYWYDDTGTIAVLYMFLTRLGLAVTIWLLARRAFGRVGAALIAIVVLPLVSEPVIPLAFGWSLWALSPRRTDRERMAFAVAGGALGGIELLGKLSTGVLVAGLAAVAVLCMGRGTLRLVAAYAGSLAGGLLVAWLVMGQSVTDLSDYAINATRIAGGYSEAMIIDGPAWHYTCALVVVCLALSGVLHATFPWPARQRLGAVGLLLLLSFLTFKSAFTRHDAFHALEFFAALLPALVLIPWRPGRRSFGLAAVAATLLVIVAMQGLRVDDLVDPLERADDAWEDVSTLVKPGERERLHDAGRDAIRRHFALGPRTLELVTGQPVHVEPYEIAVVWAYGLDWEPLPVFQGYQAYTAKLDLINADKLRGGSAPFRILVNTEPAIDERVLGWESPAAVVAMLCHYAPIQEEAGWVVLGRGTNKCGAPELISKTRVRWGSRVPVPPPRDEGMVIVKVAGMAPSGTERIQTVLFKAHERGVTLFPSGGFHDVVPGTAENGLLLSAPPGVDLPEGYGRAPNPEGIAFGRAGDDDGTIEYAFYLVPVTR